MVSAKCGNLFFHLNKTDCYVLILETYLANFKNGLLDKKKRGEPFLGILGVSGFEIYFFLLC